MVTMEVSIKGISPLMMHRFPEEPIKALEKKTREEQAEIAAYRDIDTKRLYVPASAVHRALINAAIYSKGKGRSSLQKEAAACFLVTPERLDLGVSDYIVDARPVVVPATKGRVMRYRPKLEEWSLAFELQYDPTLMSEENVRQIVDDAGSRVGLLEFRPACKGPYGRFMVTEWKKLI